MHSLTVNRKSLLEAVDIACAVVPSKTPKDVLYNVHVKSGDNSMTVSASDSEIAVCHTLDAETKGKPTEWLLKADRLRQILSQCSDETASMEYGDGKCVVKCGGRFVLQTAIIDGFPPRPKFEATEYFTVSGDVFRAAVLTAGNFVDRDDRTSSTYGAADGVLVDLKNNAVVSCDTRMLFVADVQFSDVGEPHRADIAKREYRVITTKTAKVIGRTSGRELSIAFTENETFCKSGETVISARLRDGMFVNWKRAKNGKDTGKASSIAGHLASVLKRSMICGEKESAGVRFIFTDGKLTLNSKATDIGQSECELPMAVEGKPLDAEFFAEQWLMFAGRCSPEEQIEIQYSDADSAATLSCRNWRFMAMPLRQVE